MSHTHTQSNRTEIYHDICLPWMGGSCLEHVQPGVPGAVRASLTRGDFKLVVGQTGNPTRKQGDFSPLLFNVAAYSWLRLDY